MDNVLFFLFENDAKDTGGVTLVDDVVDASSIFEIEELITCLGPLKKTTRYKCKWCDATYAHTDGVRKHARKKHLLSKNNKGPSAYCEIIQSSVVIPV